VPQRDEQDVAESDGQAATEPEWAERQQPGRRRYATTREVSLS
jgi:hypothetical protein